MNYELDLDDAFIDAFITGGSTDVTCHCGKNHVAIDSMDDWDDDPAEIITMKDAYEEQAKLDDNLVLHYECDSILLLELHTIMFVAECECKGWEPYMKFLFEDRKKIAEFLVYSAKEIKRLQSYEEVFNILEKAYER